MTASARALKRIQTLSGLESFERGRELILPGRGHPSFDFIKSLQDKEIAYVMRARKNFIRENKPQRKRDCRVTLGQSGPRVRAARVPFSSGETETLITNVGEEQVEYEAFKGLYHKRRGIETKYKTVKQRMELENFSGRLADNIKQDFYAMMTVSNIMAHFMREANREVKKAREGSGNRYEYRVNVNHAVGVYKDRLIEVVMTKGGGARAADEKTGR